MERSSIPISRLHRLNERVWREDGGYVLYWMVSARRRGWNYGLQYAAAKAEALGKPLVILEALRVGYPWASERFHSFVLEGMRSNQRAFSGVSGVLYYPYVERAEGEGKGLVEALAGEACGVVTDLFPAFFLPRMQRALAGRLRVPLEAVDSNGLLPLMAAERAYSTAYAFRRFLHKELPAHLGELPLEDPLVGLALPSLGHLSAGVEERWRRAEDLLSSADQSFLRQLPIDHSVGAVRGICGGEEAARERLTAFLHAGLPRYAEERNLPEEEVASGLSPYLHFGHISSYEIFSRIVEREGWERSHLGKPTGQRQGWWGMGVEAESFLDELVTWRELGFTTCYYDEKYEQYESLPDWAKTTLAEHWEDPRPYCYSLAELEQARTHDDLWNAAQMQLVREGRIHNYLRMLWGKKILEWTRDPKEALAVMIELNNKYALDGRDPNSYSGIFWVLGRYDRAWGPERPIFGKIRYMSSENTARKVSVRDYLLRYRP